MEKLRANIFLELIDDIITEYPNTRCIQKEAIWEVWERRNTNRQGNFTFLARLEAKIFLQIKHVI